MARVLEFVNLSICILIEGERGDRKEFGHPWEDRLTFIIGDHIYTSSGLS